MSTTISIKEVTARKSHYCNAYLYVADAINDGLQLSYSEAKMFVRMRRQRGQIQPGQKYIRCVAIWEGDFGMTHTDPAMHDICLKYNLYPDEL